MKFQRKKMSTLSKKKIYIIKQKGDTIDVGVFFQQNKSKSHFKEMCLTFQNYKCVNMVSSSSHSNHMFCHKYNHSPEHSIVIYFCYVRSWLVFITSLYFFFKRTGEKSEVKLPAVNKRGGDG